MNVSAFLVTDVGVDVEFKRGELEAVGRLEAVEVEIGVPDAGKIVSVAPPGEGKIGADSFLYSKPEITPINRKQRTRKK